MAITGALLSGRLAMDVLTLTFRVPLVLAMNTAVVVSPAIWAVKYCDLSVIAVIKLLHGKLIQVFHQRVERVELLMSNTLSRPFNDLAQIADNTIFLLYITRFDAYVVCLRRICSVVLLNSNTIPLAVIDTRVILWMNHWFFFFYVLTFVPLNDDSIHCCLLCDFVSLK